MSDLKTLREQFYDKTVDLGSLPPAEPLTDGDKKLAAITMAINAALIQFIAEGVIENGQQIHFMAHLQDFTARIYGGEEVRLNNTPHTLKVDSLVGTLFAKAAEDAFIHGHENYLSFKKAVDEASAQTAQDNQDNEGVPFVQSKPTVH